MLEITSGDILKSNAHCLVNTVNCEGFMGKGIAYQFKKTFPNNNEDYIKACQTGKLRIGTLHFFQEDNKLIINFPTKDRWREKSKINYIQLGMKELSKLIIEKDIKSIAIPPLGCGNGGLKWSDVENIITTEMYPLSKEREIYIYSPNALSYNASSRKAPNMTMSHLILMQFKEKLNKFGKIRLQKSAYFFNKYLGKEYFKFEAHKYGPYAHSIEILSKNISEYQEYYKKNTKDSYQHLLNVLISEKIKKELNQSEKSIDRSIQFVNQYQTVDKLELAATICYIIENNEINSTNDIIKALSKWGNKLNKFSLEDIEIELHNLIRANLIIQDLMEYKINNFK